MGRGMRLAAALATTAFAVLFSAGSASATFHLIKVREVSPGLTGQPNSSYVELQSYSPFQNQVQFGQLKVYNSAGTEVSSFTPAGPLANNANQATALIADSGFTAAFPGITADSVDNALDLSAAGGAVCWPITELPIDCVSWGNFTGNGNLPASAGSPFQGSGPSGAIGDGKAIIRSIAANCPTALDDADDTNNSAADFSESTPMPRPNSSPITEMTCASGGGGGGLVTAPNPKAKKKKCKKRKRKSANPGTGTGTSTPPAYAAKKKCKKKRK
jgi:hypothetical protein